MHISEPPPAPGPPPALAVPVAPIAPVAPVAPVADGLVVRDVSVHRSQIGALVAMVIGAVGPWASVFGISVAGTHGDGQVVVALAAISAVLLALSPNPRPTGATGKLTAIMVCAALALATTVYDAINLSSGGALVSLGWGLVLAMLASAALFVATLKARRSIGT